MEDFTWWMNKNCKSKLLLTCTKCGFAPLNCTVDKFMRRASGECWCNNQAKWNTLLGMQRLKELLSNSRFSLTTGIQQESLCCNTKLPLRCNICHYEPKECTLRHFKQTLSAACWCNGQAQYASLEGHKRVLNLISKYDMQPTDELCCFDWFVKNVSGEHSTIPVHCVRCGSICKSTTISNIVKRKSAGCDCKWKTEKRVKDWICEHVQSNWNECEVLGQLTLQHQRIKRGSPLKYDIGIQSSNQILLIVEVDGRQHFEQRENFLSTQLNDVEKEIAAVTEGIPMLRVFQPDVWNELFDWKHWFSEMISAAISGKLSVAVHRQPSCSKYTTGAYAERRSETIVAVM